MKGINEEKVKKIYINILGAVFSIVYGLVFNLAYENIETESLQTIVKVITMLLLFVTIFIFEKSYKKDDEKLALYGIEILVFASFTLTIEHITNKFDFEFKPYLLTGSYLFSIYFILKSLIIYTKGRKEFAQSFSDIKEIVKKEEPIIKEATKKKVEENKEEEKETKKDNTNKSKKKKSSKSKKTSNKKRGNKK